MATPSHHVYSSSYLWSSDYKNALVVEEMTFFSGRTRRSEKS